MCIIIYYYQLSLFTLPMRMAVRNSHLTMTNDGISPNSTCCVTPRHARRLARRDERVEIVRVATCLFQHGGERKSSRVKV